MKSFAIAILAVSALAAGCVTATPPEPVPHRHELQHDAAAIERPQVAAAAPSPALAQNETQVGRYTTQVTLPAEADVNPMAVIAKVHFPRQVVTTVGDAVRYMLIRTGYQLAPEETLDPRVRQVFALRLPDHQRVLGPYRVDATLSVLMGQPFKLVTDPVSRTVTYVPPSPATPASDPTSSALPTSNHQPKAGA